MQYGRMINDKIMRRGNTGIKSDSVEDRFYGYKNEKRYLRLRVWVVRNRPFLAVYPRLPSALAAIVDDGSAPSQFHLSARAQQTTKTHTCTPRHKNEKGKSKDMSPIVLQVRVVANKKHSHTQTDTQRYTYIHTWNTWRSSSRSACVRIRVLEKQRL